MIAVAIPCPKCHAENTYRRYAMSYLGRALERFCHSCGWLRTEEIMEGEGVLTPFSENEVVRITAAMEARALQLSQKASAGGKAAFRVKNGIHKPYKTYKRRGGAINEADFEVDPDTI